MKKVMLLIGMFVLGLGMSCSLQSEPSLDNKAVVNGYGEGTMVKMFYGEVEAYGYAPEYYLNFNGAIEIENAAYQKEVTIHWAYADYDGSVSGPWYDTPAVYAKSLANNKELWRWSKDGISVPFRGSVFIRFAIRYRVNGVEYWDNNNGADYLVGVSYFVTIDRMAMGKSEVAMLSSKMYYVPSDQPFTQLTGMVYTAPGITEGQVFLVYSTDNWATVKTQVLTCNTYNPNEWSFNVNMPGKVNEVVYCFSFNHDGTSSWDNNFGEDHHMLIP